MSTILLRGVEVGGLSVDVRVRHARIDAVAPRLVEEPGDEVMEGNGGALIPGLHDHHLHLLATAAADRSIRLGPPEVRTRAEFVAALRRAVSSWPHDGWLRGVGYHESVAGELDRAALDAIVPDRCLRIQHRSGALWIMNSRALSALGIESTTGRLYGSDEWLRTRLPPEPPPSLAAVGTRLASYGVTGVTDATPITDLESIELLARAASDGELPQNVVVMGAPMLAAAPDIDGVRWGPVKFVIADHALSDLDDVRGAIELAHSHDRSIAIHCVTDVALALALAAWLDTGAREGDRIEHGAVITPAAAVRIAELGLVVVTNPGFIATRGDQYLTDVDVSSLPCLYPCASLLAAGVGVGAGTDAPFGDLDPWRAIDAAIQRRTESGAVLGADEQLSRGRALELFLTAPDDPGGRPRRVAPGAPADLCLLDEPLEAVLATPGREHVAATLIRGRLFPYR